MKTPKNLLIIRCRQCNGEYFGNETRVTLHPGTEDQLPDELSIIIRKVSKCTGCKEMESRTKGMSRKDGHGVRHPFQR